MSKPPIALEARVTSGSRLHSPSAGRNKDVIAEKLAALLPQKAQILEIASGTGEHGAALGALRADVAWQYSDPDAQSRNSQAAWARQDWPDPLNLDVTMDSWWAGLPDYDAIFCANMIHIAPWAAAEGLADGAAQLAQCVYLYGPFLLGEVSAEGNLRFDATLRGRNPDWGVRELESVKHMFAKRGFTVSDRFDMPANNFIVRLAKA